MQLFDTIHKRKSAIITSIILLLLLFVMYGFGMRYMDPPIEYGVAINFGDSDAGSGQPVEKVKADQPKTEEVKEEQEEIKEEVQETPKEEVNEEILTDDTAKDVPVVEKVEEKTEEKKEVVKEEKKEKIKPKPSKAATDALNSLLKGNSPDGDNVKGEGDDTQQGVKGDKKGDPDANKYYGNTGGGSGGNYNLSGRKALSKPIEKPDCQEEGTVSVTIKVDQNGNVIEAKPGAKGTTNSAPCLFDAAKKAALKTKWNADGKAPETQVGTIIYKFSLSK